MEKLGSIALEVVGDLVSANSQISLLLAGKQYALTESPNFLMKTKTSG